MDGPRALRGDLIDPAIAVHHGRVVKRTGDGLIVEFRSVIDAVRCALEAQHGMAERNRNTAFTFKGKSIDAKAIGKELGVRYVLEGSVQRDQGRVRVNVQLIDAESGNHLWAERFDKPLADLLDTQDEIVSRLANQLGTVLTAAEAQRAKRASNPRGTGPV